MRDCESCIYARPYGGENDNRCSAWSCEYINRQEAIELWKASKWRPMTVKPDSGEMGKDYLVYTEFGFGIATYFPNDKWNGYDVMGDGFDERIILAWMPLPEPWKDNDMGVYIEDLKKNISFKLNHPLTEEDWDKLMDTELEQCTEVVFHTKKDKEVVFIKKGE